MICVSLRTADLWLFFTDRCPCHGSHGLPMAEGFDLIGQRFFGERVKCHMTKKSTKCIACVESYRHTENIPDIHRYTIPDMQNPLDFSDVCRYEKKDLPDISSKEIPRWHSRGLCGAEQCHHGGAGELGHPNWVGCFFI